MKNFYNEIDTPAVIVDYDIALQNIKMVQKIANDHNVKLRPHIKTHKMPFFAKLQVQNGASGIACAKIGEAEVFSDSGIDDIFIANEIVGKIKYERIKKLHEKIKIRIGVDNKFQIGQIEEVFSDAEKPLEVLIEYEVGENRSGIITDEQLTELVNYIKTKKHVVLKGIFSHEGHTYKSETRKKCVEEAEIAYKKTLRAANMIRDLGVEIDTVSIGATPSILNGAFVAGITEIRIGTYIFFDLGQSNAINDKSHCAATVLASVISKPNDERVVLDSGAKALVNQNRSGGICATNGFGFVKDSDNVNIAGLYDEHGLILDKNFSKKINVGDKIEIIPSHICPTINLYDKVYLISNDKIIDVIPIAARGKCQ